MGVHEPCLAKTGLKIFVIVIAKEGLAGTSQAKSPFGLTPNTEWTSAIFTDYIL